MADSKVVLFNEGEGLVSADFNNIVKGATQRAWEWPGYGALFPQAPLSATAFNSLWSGATDLDKAAFTAGPGLAPTFSGFSSYLGAGMIGVYAGVSPPVILDPKMRWTYINGAHETAHAVNAHATLERWDAVVVTTAEAGSDSESRHFEDAVTGAKSTVSMNKRTTLTATITKREGTAGGGISIFAGDRILYAVRLPPASAAIDDAKDLTFPIGHPRVTFRDGGLAHGFSVGAGAWSTGIVAEAPDGTTKYYVPAPCAGDPSRRLLGIYVGYALSASATVKLVRLNNQNGVSVVEDITSRFTLDGADRQVVIDLRGEPFVASGSGPIWGHGQRYKAATIGPVSLSPPYLPTRLYLEFKGGAINDSVVNVGWVES